MILRIVHTAQCLCLFFDIYDSMPTFCMTRVWFTAWLVEQRSSVSAGFLFADDLESLSSFGAVPRCDPALLALVVIENALSVVCGHNTPRFFVSNVSAGFFRANCCQILQCLPSVGCLTTPSRLCLCFLRASETIPLT